MSHLPTIFTPTMPVGILPIELLEEIFIRLPVKSLISLTIICKSWLALISSQSFAKSHLSSYHLNPNNHLLLHHVHRSDKITISTLNFLDIPMISIITIPVAEITCAKNAEAHQQDQNSTFRLVGSINGLVCLSWPYDDKPTNVLIWNPATHRLKDIVVPHLNLGGFVIYVGFAYECVADDYKIVCIYRIWVEGNTNKTRFRMYSCNDDSWKDLETGFDFNMRSYWNKVCVTVKGNPFWFVFDKHEEKFLLTVNVESEVIRVFSEPNYVTNGDSFKSIMALGDKPAQIVYSPGAEPNDLINVYALEESSGVWTLMYTINLGPIGILDFPCEFECYNNGKFVFKDDHGNLFAYDLDCADQIKDLGVGELVTEDNYYRTINYIESLVSIEGMERVREEVGQKAALSANDRDTSDAI